MRFLSELEKTLFVILGSFSFSLDILSSSFITKWFVLVRLWRKKKGRNELMSNSELTKLIRSPRSSESKTRGHSAVIGAGLYSECLVRGFYPMTTVRRFPPFLGPINELIPEWSSRLWLTWPRRVISLVNSLFAEIRFFSIGLLIRFSLVWPLKWTFFFLEHDIWRVCFA